MNPLQAQINEINQKVDQLRDIVQNIGDNLSFIANPQPSPLTSLATAASPRMALPKTPEVARPAAPVPALMEHKDIISDEYIDSSFFFPGGDAFMTADIQIRRLTAQLTAAYNRIAALEEQLIARRTRN